jgi:hypothetical protein
MEPQEEDTARRGGDNRADHGLHAVAHSSDQNRVPSRFPNVLCLKVEKTGVKYINAVNDPQIRTGR